MTFVVLADMSGFTLPFLQNGTLVVTGKEVLLSVSARKPQEIIEINCQPQEHTLITDCVKSSTYWLIIMAKLA